MKQRLDGPLARLRPSFRQRAVSQRMTSGPRLGTKHVPLAAWVDRLRQGEGPRLLRNIFVVADAAVALAR